MAETEECVELDKNWEAGKRGAEMPYDRGFQRGVCLAGVS